MADVHTIFNTNSDREAQATVIKKVDLPKDGADTDVRIYLFKNAFQCVFCQDGKVIEEGPKRDNEKSKSQQFLQELEKNEEVPFELKMRFPMGCSVAIFDMKFDMVQTTKPEQAKFIGKGVKIGEGGLNLGLVKAQSTMELPSSIPKPPDLAKSNSWSVDELKSPTKIRVKFYNNQHSILKFNEDDTIEKLYESVEISCFYNRVAPMEKEFKLILSYPRREILRDCKKSIKEEGWEIQMGQSLPQFTPYTFFTHFVHIDTINDPTFGYLYVFKEKHGPRVVNVQNIALDNKGNMTKIDLYEGYELRDPAPNLLKVYQYFQAWGRDIKKYIPSEEWDDKEVCDMIIFDMYDRDLYDEMAQMRSKGKAYTEDDLWKLADCCINALAKMQYYNIPHHKVSSRQIFRCGGTYKMSYLQSVIHCVTHRDREINKLAFCKNVRDMGRVLLQASSLGESSGEGQSIASRSQYSKGWNKFLRELTDPNRRTDALNLYKKCGPLETLQNDYEVNGPVIQEEEVKIGLPPVTQNVVRQVVRPHVFQQQPHLYQPIVPPNYSQIYYPPQGSPGLVSRPTVVNPLHSPGIINRGLLSSHEGYLMGSQISRAFTRSLQSPVVVQNQGLSRFMPLGY